jgi:Chaperone of endosialidase
MKPITTITHPGFALFMLACFALEPQARATCQEGCLTLQNTVLGEDALFSLTTGLQNTAMGFNALFSNTTGIGNTATGTFALANNTTGNDNTATGSGALIFNTTGNDNTATGFSALSHNTTGFHNTATGDDALYFNTTGSGNVAMGSAALISNTTGVANMANGFEALESNTTGINNTASGSAALHRNTTGSNNIALGTSAGANLTTGNNNIDIFDKGVVGEANTIRIGKEGTQRTTFIAGISGATVPTGVAVIVDTTGHLGTTTSSARFKDEIKSMDKASEAILALKPVTFRYKHDLDPAGVPQFGLVAEDVEKVNPDLVARDEQGKPYTVRYEAVNAMLLNEFLKEHKTVQEQGATIARLEKQVEALTAGLQEVSAQLEASKPAPQVVNNP